ncbi:unnamed protein product, partial [Polarella glacialis]
MSPIRASGGLSERMRRSGEAAPAVSPSRASGGLSERMRRSGGGESPKSASRRPLSSPVSGLGGGDGQWEVHTVKRGWAPLAPALQGALSRAMAAAEDQVEILIDPSTRSWVPDPAALNEAARERCSVYAAFPRERKMGKVGGEPPRPVRWRSGAPLSSVLATPPPLPLSTQQACSGTLEQAPPLPSASSSPKAEGSASTEAAPEDHIEEKNNNENNHQDQVADRATPPSEDNECDNDHQEHSGIADSAASIEGEETSMKEEEDDPLMFTAKPST